MHGTSRQILCFACGWVGEAVVTIYQSAVRKPHFVWVLWSARLFGAICHPEWAEIQTYLQLRLWPATKCNSQSRNLTKASPNSRARD